MLIQCPNCEADVECRGQQTGIHCMRCGERFFFLACDQCEAISAVPWSMTTWDCPACGDENERYGDETTCTAEEYARDLKQAHGDEAQVRLSKNAAMRLEQIRMLQEDDQAAGSPIEEQQAPLQFDCPA